MEKAKSYHIPKRLVWQSYKRVRANKGSYGIDKESLTDFEKDLRKNLYKIWNRMSSGSYFPPAVRVVEITKSGGGVRKLGIPTVSDRIAQMVVKLILEPKLNPIFHEDSYGYRPNKSALQAVGTARERCWKHQWVLDIDIKGYFDNINHELMMKAVRRHTEEKWICLYVERWLKAEAVTSEEEKVARDKGTPQGGVISPLLANLYLHYAFDMWMNRTLPSVQFERYADDIIVHCHSLEQSRELKERIAKRLRECRLEMHPTKTKIVHCNNGQGNNNWQYQEFDFLGYTFRPRSVRTRQGIKRTGFLPAVSRRAAKEIRDEIRSWHIPSRTSQSLGSMAEYINPKLRGWALYYGRYYKSELYFSFRMLNSILAKWAMNKYKKLRGRKTKASHWLGRLALRQPKLFYHWQMALLPTTGQ